MEEVCVTEWSNREGDLTLECIVLGAFSACTAFCFCVSSQNNAFQWLIFHEFLNNLVLNHYQFRDEKYKQTLHFNTTCFNLRFTTLGSYVFRRFFTVK